jgi:DNA-binding protein YbaB
MNLQSLLNDDNAIETLQDIVNNITVTGQTPSGKIKIIMNGSKQVTAINFDSSLTVGSPEQVLALEKALLVALKDAEEKSEEALVELLKQSQDK